MKKGKYLHSYEKEPVRWNRTIELIQHSISKTAHAVETEAQREITFLGSANQMHNEVSSYICCFSFPPDLTTKSFPLLLFTGLGYLIKSGRHSEKREKLYDATNTKVEKVEVIINQGFPLGEGSYWATLGKAPGETGLHSKSYSLNMTQEVKWSHCEFLKNVFLWNRKFGSRHSNS